MRGCRTTHDGPTSTPLSPLCRIYPDTPLIPRARTQPARPDKGADAGDGRQGDDRVDEEDGQDGRCVALRQGVVRVMTLTSYLGYRGLLDGISGTWMRQMSYSVCRFWAYDESKKIIGAGM